MEVESIKIVYNGPVSTTKEVVISVSSEEADELRQALKIVDKYRLGAFKSIKHKERLADWTMVSFAVKNDKVIVCVEAGACG